MTPPPLTFEPPPESGVETAATAAIAAAVRTILAVAPALEPPGPEDPVTDAARDGAARGWYRPEEAERLRDRFAVYLTARDALHAVLAEVRPRTLPTIAGRRVDEAAVRRFVVAWTAACLLVRAARVMVEALGGDDVLRRKLDEVDLDRRIAAGRFRAVRRSLTSPASAWRLAAGLRHADGLRERIDRVLAEPPLADLRPILEACEPAVRLSVGRYLLARLRYRCWSLGGRARTAWRSLIFGGLRIGGSAVASMRLPGRTRRLRPEVRAAVLESLAPGDVLITRHEAAVSNLFLPGHWPHAALHVGPRDVLAARGVAPPPETDARWPQGARFLEARKDGVRLRTPEDTLAVDAVCVLRPRLAAGEIDLALGRGLRHEGKLYNFDFDFFTEDRLVCTEVVYRAFDGVGGIRMELSRRSGRPTLSAEDLIRAALAGEGFDLLLVAGSAVRGGGIATGERARSRVRATLRAGGGGDPAAATSAPAWGAAAGTAGTSAPAGTSARDCDSGL